MIFKETKNSLKTNFTSFENLKLKKNGNLKENTLSTNFEKKNYEINKSIVCPLLQNLSWTRFTASWTRFTALGGHDSQQCGIRIGLFKFNQSTSYVLCLKGSDTVFVGSRMCKASFPKFLSRNYSEEKKVEEGQLVEKEETEDNQNKAKAQININIFNFTINNTTNFNVFNERLPNTIRINGEVVDKKTHHILQKNNVIMPINGRFDGGVTKELEKLNYYQGKDLIALRKEIITCEERSKESNKGKHFFIKLNNPKINFESIDFPIDIFLGEERLAAMFSYLTTKYINKLFTTKKTISIIDHRKRSFVYKKNNYYENIETKEVLIDESGKKKEKKKKIQKLVSRNEIGTVETMYVGHKKTTGLSSIIFYNKGEKENLAEWKGIFRIEVHIKADKMHIVDAFRNGNTQQEMTRKIIKEIIREFIVFKKPSNPSKIQKENLYRTPNCITWENFLLEIEKGIENMGTIDDHILKELLKQKEEKNYLFIDKPETVEELVEKNTSELTLESINNKGNKNRL